AEGQNVAAIAHGNGDADRGLAIDPEHRLWRIGIGAVHLSDVAQPNEAPVRDEVDPQNVLLGFESAGDPQCESFITGLQKPGGADDVLSRQCGGKRGTVDPETRELLNREFDEDFFVLGTEDLDFRHIGDVHQARANVLDVIFQLAMSEPVGRDAINYAEY